MLLNSVAVAKMHMGEFQEAESSLVEVSRRGIEHGWCGSY